jgi:putative solute:sodium symporter small subunit
MIKGECIMSKSEQRAEPSEADKQAYWRATKRLTISLLVVWFAVSFGAGILFRPWLDNFSIGGAPMGFWFAQNGAIYVFLVLIVIYCVRMTRLEARYGLKG